MKGIILFLSVMGLVSMIITNMSVEFGICAKKDGDCLIFWDMIENNLHFTVFIFPFALITFLSSKKIFISWWRFARIAIPLIFILIYIINLELHHQSGGYMSFDYEMDFLLKLIMYFTFTIGSIIQIVRGYRAK